MTVIHFVTLFPDTLYHN